MLATKRMVSSIFDAKADVSQQTRMKGKPFLPFRHFFDLSQHSAVPPFPATTWHLHIVEKNVPQHVLRS
jgi:hypothetical protein